MKKLKIEEIINSNITPLIEASEKEKGTIIVDGWQIETSYKYDKKSHTLIKKILIRKLKV